VIDVNISRYYTLHINACKIAQDIYLPTSRKYTGISNKIVWVITIAKVQIDIKK